MSNHSEGLDITGKLVVKKNGEVVREIPNVVVNAGKGYVADRMKNSTTVMNAMAVGTSDASSSDATKTALVGTELGRVSSSNFTTTVSTSARTVTYQGTFGTGTGTGSIKEAGIFNSTSASSGTMLCRTTFPVVTKGASDTLTIDWVITIS